MPIGIGAAILGGSVVAAGAGLASAGVAANAATSAANKNDALEKSIYDQNTANLNPFLTTGTSANTAQANFLGLNGAQPQSQAYNNYLNSTGYNFTVNQGINAITGNQAASGLLKSGSTLKALDTYGEGEAQTFGNNYLNQLSGLSGQGVAAGGAIAGVGENYAGQVSANNNSAATNVGNAAIAGANTTNGLISNGLGAYFLQSGLSSYGAPNASSFGAAAGAAGPSFASLSQ